MVVKHAGFSFHDTPELLDEILTKHPEMEFVQLMINYLDWNSEWVQSRACYEVAMKYEDYPQLLENGGGKATDCIACGQCEGVCPQHITIIENLKMIARHIE